MQSSCDGLSGRGERKTDFESGAKGAIEQRDLTTVRMSDGVGNGQSEPGPAPFASGGTGLAMDEPLKEAWPQCRVHASAFVGHAQVQPC
jgi:hypothetical protein